MAHEGAVEVTQAKPASAFHSAHPNIKVRKQSRIKTYHTCRAIRIYTKAEISQVTRQARNTARFYKQHINQPWWSLANPCSSFFDDLSYPPLPLPRAFLSPSPFFLPSFDRASTCFCLFFSTARRGDPVRASRDPHARRGVSVASAMAGPRQGGRNPPGRAH